MIRVAPFCLRGFPSVLLALCLAAVGAIACVLRVDLMAGPIGLLAKLSCLAAFPAALAWTGFLEPEERELLSRAAGKLLRRR